LPETKLEIFTIQNWKKGLMSTLCSFWTTVQMPQ
jgi:hypothetical protein